MDEACDLGIPRYVYYPPDHIERKLMTCIYICREWTGMVRESYEHKGTPTFYLYSKICASMNPACIYSAYFMEYLMELGIIKQRHWPVVYDEGLKQLLDFRRKRRHRKVMERMLRDELLSPW